MSRVIKEESLKSCSVCNVNYESLINSGQKEADSYGVYMETAGFTPLFFNDHLGLEHEAEIISADGSGSDQPGDELPDDKGSIPEGMLVIAETDLQKQLTDAYERGAEEGRLVAERGLAHVFRALRQGAETLVSLREKVLRESECDLLKLSCMVARKIILQEINQDPRILAKIVAATVSLCSEQEKVTICLSPEDYQKLMADRQMFSGVVDDESRVAFAPLDSIKLGGCMVETPTGTVDARIEAQLDEVYNRCMEEGGIPKESLIVPDDEAQVR